MKLLDTSAVVDIDRGGIAEKVQALDEQGRHAISMVTVTELRLGVELQCDRGTDAYRQATDGLDRLLSRFEVYPISRPIVTAAAEIIAGIRDDGQRLDHLHDVYIGATARTAVAGPDRERRSLRANRERSGRRLGRILNTIGSHRAPRYRSTQDVRSDTTTDRGCGDPYRRIRIVPGSTPVRFDDFYNTSNGYGFQ